MILGLKNIVAELGIGFFKHGGEGEEKERGVVKRLVDEETVTIR